MASKPDPERILSGGLELLSPGDKLAAGNSLILDNFRVDQGNELRSRFGTFKQCGPIGSGIFHTLRRTANARYAGIGPTLYNGTNLENSVVTGLDGNPLGLAFYQGRGWLMNPAKQRSLLDKTSVQWGVPAPVTAPKATGGGQVSTLINEFDSGNITVAVASPPTDTDPFSVYAMKNGAPITNDPPNDTVTAKFDSGNKRSGGASLQVIMSAAAAINAYASGGGDTSINGQISDEDVIRVWFYASNPSLIDSLAVYVKSAGGYAEYSFDPAKFVNQALNSWTQLKVRRRLNLDDWSQRIASAANPQGQQILPQDTNPQQTVSDIESQFATMVQSPTFVITGSGWPQTNIGGAPPATYPPSAEMLALNWHAITELGVSVKVTDACQVGVDRAEVIGTVGDNSTGAIQFFVTFANSLGQDSNPSPASNSVIAGENDITLTNLPISSSPDVQQRWIYRIGGGLSQAMLVQKIYDNSTTGPVLILTSNAQAQADGIVMPINRDLPPPAKGCIGPVFGKIIAFNTAAHPARIFWTPSAQPWFFPGAADDFVGNWEDVGADDDELVEATDHKQMVLFYKHRSIWRLAGDPVTTDVVKTNSNVGLVGRNAVVNGGPVDYFVGSSGIGDGGVYRFNGDFETKLSGAIDPIFKGDYVQLSDGEYLPPVDMFNISTCAIALMGDRLRVAYPETGQTLPNVVAILHLPSGRWAREKYTGLAAPNFTVMFNEGPGSFQMAGGTAGGGYLYALEARGGDDGAAVHCVWQSKFYDQSLPNNLKVYTDIEVDCQTAQGQSANAMLTVYLVIDNGTKIQIGTLQSSDPYGKGRFSGIVRVMSADGSDVGRTAKNAAVRLEADVTGVVIIYGVYLHWYPEERIARSFDTGPTDFGIPERCKEVDYLELYMTASGQQLRRVVSSDLPGSLLVHRDDANLTAPNGRGNVRFRLGAPIDGRNFRWWIGDSPSNSTFQIHQARARMRPIGEYIDGTIGEYFESPEFSVAPGRVGELKDFLVDYDSSGGAGYMNLYTDLPGNAMALIRQAVIPQQTRAVRVLPWENPALSQPGGGSTSLPAGQLFKVRLYPPTGGILRLHGRAVFRARIIGVYFDGTRGEIWETQPLDLMGGMTIFREVSIVTQCDGPMTLEVRTELPNQDMRTIATFTVNPQATTAGRLPFIGRLPGSAKGRLQQIRLIGPHVARVFECKLLARRVQENGTGWDWIPVPLEATPDAWAEIPMPVRQTPEAFTWIDMAVDEIA